MVIFVPVIPLGKKRIMDMCSICKWHYAMPLGKWEEMQQLGISSAKAEYEADPVVEKAIGYHQTLLNFHEHEAAKVFREEMRRRFEMSALMHAYLGETLLEQGAVPESDTAYRRAFELKPDLPAARLGMAQIHLRARQLDDARRMLDFMEQPGAEELGSLAPLETLAVAFQDAGRHKEALELLNRLHTAYPHIAKVHGFRKLVERSEKALAPADRQAPMLPRMSLWERVSLGPMKKWAMAGGIAALVVLLAVGQNLYVKANREVHVVNGWDSPVAVSVDGGAPREVAVGGYEIVPISEGAHVVRYTGAYQAEEPLQFESGFWARWGNEMLVLNPGGRAILLENEAHYSSNPMPPILRIHGGVGFERIEDVTHPFKVLPETVSMKRREKERVLTSVEVFDGSAAQVMMHYLNQNDRGGALTVAEQLLPGWSDDENLLLNLNAVARMSQQPARTVALLRPYLARRPINVALHRCYQDMLRLQEGYEKASAALQKEYEGLLGREGDSSELLYLYARSVDDDTQEEMLLGRAVKAEPVNPWAHYSLGLRRSSEAKWNEALHYLDKAFGRNPDNVYFERGFYVARLAVRDYDALVKNLDEVLAQNATNEHYALMLAEVLISKRDTAALEKLLESYEKFSGRSAEGMAANARFKAQVLLMQGDYDAAYRLVSAQTTEKQAQVELQVLRGRLQEALAIPAAATMTRDDPEFPLAVALAFELRGERKTADEWLKLAQKGQINVPHKKALEVLAASSNPDPAVLLQARMPVTQGALVAAIMSLRGAENREAFRTFAQDRNVRLVFPAALIDKAVRHP